MEKIRNFCIIAHIDHGKSTLADRLLENTKTLSQKELVNQVLDDMDLERERGITIKSHAIQMNYVKDGVNYTLNLIDTPGHVDFSYEVSRSIAACEGALLVVDATQGIQAQTISNLYMAMEHDLEIIPVINKIDMDSANPEMVEDQIVDLIGCERSDILRCSARNNIGIEEILEAIVNRIPAPKGDPNAPLQALIFDSVFNSYRGIIAYFRIFNGTIRKDELVKFFATKMEYHADEIGVLQLKQVPKDELSAGNVGYIISGIKTSSEVKVGDTITVQTVRTSFQGTAQGKDAIYVSHVACEVEEEVVPEGCTKATLVMKDLGLANAEGVNLDNLQEIMDENLKQLNTMVASYEKVANIVIHREEFVKTPKRSIKRYLYSAERLNLN